MTNGQSRLEGFPEGRPSSMAAASLDGATTNWVNLSFCADVVELVWG